MLRQGHDDNLAEIEIGDYESGGQNAELEDRVGRYALHRGLGTWKII